MDPVDEAYRRLATEVIRRTAVKYRDIMTSPAIRNSANPKLKKSLENEAAWLRKWFYSSTFALYAPNVDPDYIVRKLDEDVETILSWSYLPYLVLTKVRKKQYAVVKADDWDHVLKEYTTWDFAAGYAAKLTGLSARLYSLIYHRLCRYGYCPMHGGLCNSRYCEKRDRKGCAAICPQLKRGS